MSTIPHRRRNGIDVAKLYGTLDAIKARPKSRAFSSERATAGSMARTTARPSGFYAASQEDTSRAQAFDLDAAEPAILIGEESGPHHCRVSSARARRLPDDIDRLRGRRTQGGAPVRGVDRHRRQDARGALGVDEGPRNGLDRIGVSFRVTGDAPEEQSARSWSEPKRGRRSRHGRPRRAGRLRGDDALKPRLIGRSELPAWRVRYVVPATRSAPIWVMVPMCREPLHRKVLSEHGYDGRGPAMTMTEQELGSVPEKVSGRRAGEPRAAAAHAGALTGTPSAPRRFAPTA